MYLNRFSAILLISNFSLSFAHSETVFFDGDGFIFREGILREWEYHNDDNHWQDEDEADLPPTRRRMWQVGDEVFTPRQDRVRARDTDDEGGFEDGTPLKRPRTQDVDFFAAVQGGDLAQILEAAEQPGFDVNVRNEVQATALHIAAGANLIEVTLLLLDLGADPLQTNASGETPDQKAENYGFAELAQILRNRAPNPNANNN